jgi:hypothetical protein
LLEIARDAASQLSIKSPQLYADFVKGLTGEVPPPAAAGQPAAAASAEKKGANEAAILADRLAKWKALCKSHEDIVYWQEVQNDYRERLGPTCAVDEEILAGSSDVDVKRYHRGKRAREDALAMVGLERKPGGIALLPGFQEPEDKPLTLNPMLPHEEKHIGGQGFDPQAFTNLLAMFMTAATLSHNHGGGTEGNPQGKSKVPPGPPKGGNSGSSSDPEA